MKGVVVAGVVRFIRKRQRSGALPEKLDLGEGAEHLLTIPIVPSAWCDYSAYLELMELVYSRVLGRDLEALAGFSAAGAPVVYGGAHRSLIEQGRPERTIRNVKVHWRICHDFGRAVSEVGQSEALVHIHDALPMSEVEGTINAGWIGGILSAAGANHVQREILESPWTAEGNDRLTIRYRWR